MIRVDSFEKAMKDMIAILAILRRLKLLDTTRTRITVLDVRIMVANWRKVVYSAASSKSEHDTRVRGRTLEGPPYTITK